MILGLVQGLTEFLPVSSSGHLVIFRELLGAEAPSDLVFEITVHVATALATIVVFRKQILDLLQGLFKFKYNEQTDFIAKLVVSMIPVAIVGFFFKDKVEELFSSLLVVGCALMVTALLLFLSDRVKARKEGKEITFGQALVMGLGQAVAVIPGLSRSGTTIGWRRPRNLFNLNCAARAGLFGRILQRAFRLQGDDSPCEESRPQVVRPLLRNRGTHSDNLLSGIGWKKGT